MAPSLFRTYFLIVYSLTNLRTFHTHRTSFDEIVSFGDSNTDTGNVHKLTNYQWPFVPPYFHGRFSDGPVWIEMLGVSSLKNYAHGGATSDNFLVQGYTQSGKRKVPGVRQQIETFHNETKRRQEDRSRTLFTVWVGGNDYFFDKNLNSSQIVRSILNCVHDLLKIGAKHILVLNKSPVEMMPFLQETSDMHYYRKLTNEHNQILSNGLRVLSYNFKEVSIRLFDVHEFMLNISRDDSLNFVNKTEACWIVADKMVVVHCPNPKSFIFIDQYHLTTRVHALLSQAVRQFILSGSKTISSSHSIVILMSFLCLIYSSFERHDFLPLVDHQRKGQFE